MCLTCTEIADQRHKVRLGDHSRAQSQKLSMVLPSERRHAPIVARAQSTIAVSVSNREKGSSSQIWVRQAVFAPRLVREQTRLIDVLGEIRH